MRRPSARSATHNAATARFRCLLQRRARPELHRSGPRCRAGPPLHAAACRSVPCRDGWDRNLPGSSRVRCTPVIRPPRSVTQAMTFAGQVSVGNSRPADSSSADGSAGYLHRTRPQCHDEVQIRLPDRPAVGCDIVKSRRAAWGDTVWATGRTNPAAGSGSERGKLRNRRASSATSRNLRRPQLSRMMSRRSPCSPVAASVHLPACPFGNSYSRTNIERPGVFLISPTSQ